MATRAERFKAELQRSSGPKREPSKAKRQATKTPSARTGAGAAPGDEPAARAGRAQSARAKADSTAKPNQPREGRLKSGKGIYVLETPQTVSRPSRKSTRKSKAHVKSGTPLTTRTQLRANSPSRRHVTRA
jgi:hypothetical protein